MNSKIDKKTNTYLIALPSRFKDKRVIKFTQDEADEYFAKLDETPDLKFSISIPPEYREILSMIASKKTKQINNEIGFLSVKINRNAIIKEAIRIYIKKQGYVITKEALQLKSLKCLELLMMANKKATKLKELPRWT